MAFVVDQPGRRRNNNRATRLSSSQWWITCFIVVLVLCDRSEALAIGRNAVVDWAENSALRFVQPRKIVARQDPLSGPSTQSVAASSTPAPSSAIPNPSSTTSIGSSPTTSSASPSLTALPKFFDFGLGSNFSSSSCPNFLQGLNDDASFNACLPLSQLLQSSHSFFEVESSPDALTAVLDATCAVVFPTCNSLMASLAVQLKDSANCGADYSLGNPIVTQGYNAFLSYEPVYQAGCLKASPVAQTSSSPSGSSSSNDNSSSNEYCFVAATKNSTLLTNSFLYSLPIGIQLPGGIRPVCSPCLQQTMKYFAAAATNMSSPLSTDYQPAAQEINSGCGPNFVQGFITPTPGSGTSAASTTRIQLSPVLAVMLALGFLLA